MPLTLDLHISHDRYGSSSDPSLNVHLHRETDRFFAASGVQLAQFDRGHLHFRRAGFSSQLKSRVGNILAKTATLRVNLNLDGAPITFKSHTHPSHSQTSQVLSLALALLL